MKLSQLIPLGLLVAAGVGCTPPAPGSREPSPPRLVKTLTISQPETMIEAEFPARLEPVRAVNLAFEVSGRLQELPVQVGDRLEQGELIARLDQQAFKARLDGSRAPYQKARNDVQRLGKLRATDTIPQTEYEDAQTRLDVAASQLALNKKAYEDSTLKAPFAGQLVAVYLDNFTYVAASTIVARMVDTSQLEVWVNVPEDLAILQSRIPDYQAEVIVDAFPERAYPASFKEFGPEASALTRSFPASFVIDQAADVELLPGMSARLRIQARRDSLGLADVIKVPFSALLPDAKDHAGVWLVKAGRVERQRVKLGEISGDGIEITTGLQAGDVLVTAGVNELAEGQQVLVEPLSSSVCAEGESCESGGF